MPIIWLVGSALPTLTVQQALLQMLSQSAVLQTVPTILMPKQEVESARPPALPTLICMIQLGSASILRELFQIVQTISSQIQPHLNACLYARADITQTLQPNFASKPAPLELLPQTLPGSVKQAVLIFPGNMRTAQLKLVFIDALVATSARIQH